MDLRSFLSGASSSVRQWARGHERILVAGGCWALAALLIVISVWKLLQSLALI